MTRTPPLALVIDDEPDIRELLEITLGRMQVDTRAAGSVAEARQLLTQHHFDLCLTDMRLPDGDGIELVELIAKEHPRLPVAVITAHGNMETAITSLKAGAFDFVSKPVDLQQLRKLVESALKLARPPCEPRPTDPESGPGQPLPAGHAPRLLGKSPIMENLRQLIAKLARSQAPVHITGESGTGKELAARLIHNQGPRQEGAFVAVNCGAIPHELMESELFGHTRGSFTGANSDKMGLFQAADGGTLFLDEVADLPLPMQVKLLRVIQEKSVRPVGATQEIPIDVRIISATHKELPKLVDQGLFRQDLFYRINVIELFIPPLRERREDIPLLVDQVLSRITRQSDMAKPRVAREALNKLYHYAFPGNVRELENILERACALCDNGMIEEADLQLSTGDPGNTRGVADRGELPLEAYLEQVERQLITEALEQTRWNRTAAAERLGITFRALRYRMSKLGIE